MILTPQSVYAVAMISAGDESCTEQLACFTLRVKFGEHECGLTSSLPVSSAFGWRRARFPSKSRANAMRSCHLTPRLQVRAPWLLLTRSWWTWARPPRTHLRPARCGDGGGGGDGQHPGPPRYPVAPFSPAATAASCWPRPHLVREESKFSKDDFPPQNWLNPLH